MQQPLIFWDVDTQADFLSPDGVLYVPGSQAILPNLRRLTQWASAHGILIVASACAHHPGDPEFRDWPPHCLVNTPGQRKIPETTLAHPFVIPNCKVEIPAEALSAGQILLEKQELDVFSNPNSGALLARLGHPQVVLYGVVTEFCVALAARQLLERGCPVRLVKDAICALDEAKAQSLIGDLTALGAKLVSTAEVTP